jgi:phosphoribosylformimino-5-aminoimidazole carboxamide ribotide isomerase
MDGKAVQLVQGKTKKLERNNPVQLAREFSKYSEIQVIDLDAALGKGNNLELIKEICKVAECRVGGGIRTVEKAKELLRGGARKVIIGTSASKKFLIELPKERVIVAVDSKEGKVVKNGWTEKTNKAAVSVVKELSPYCSEFLYTYVDKEGTMQGTDIETVKKLMKLTNNKINVAGGISSLEEISEIEKIGANSVLGMALYTGRMSIRDAFMATLDFSKELIPTIVQDTSGQVLMLAYSNKESLKNVFRTGKGWYYSRSKKNLWMKGETSKNFQKIIKIRKDCDGDALLFTVEQSGVACHSGTYSCFGDREFTLNALYEIIEGRKKKPVKGSYINKLFTHRKGSENKILEKIGEELTELILASKSNNRDELVYESADLIFHLLILLCEKGIPFKKVVEELRARRASSAR